MHFSMIAQLDILIHQNIEAMQMKISSNNLMLMNKLWYDLMIYIPRTITSTILDMQIG